MVVDEHRTKLHNVHTLDQQRHDELMGDESPSGGLGEQRKGLEDSQRRVVQAATDMGLEVVSAGTHQRKDPEIGEFVVVRAEKRGELANEGPVEGAETGRVWVSDFVVFHPVRIIKKSFKRF